jgi:hypothetical protein
MVLKLPIQILTFKCTTSPSDPFFTITLHQIFMDYWEVDLLFFWTGGESDAMDPTAYGVAISLGGGYDYPINQQIDIGAFVKVIYHNTWADDEGVDYYTQSLIAPAIGLSVTYKM